MCNLLHFDVGYITWILYLNSDELGRRCFWWWRWRHLLLLLKTFFLCWRQQRIVLPSSAMVGSNGRIKESNGTTCVVLVYYWHDGGRWACAMLVITMVSESKCCRCEFHELTKCSAGEWDDAVMPWWIVVTKTWLQIPHRIVHMFFVDTVSTRTQADDVMIVSKIPLSSLLATATNTKVSVFLPLLYCSLPCKKQDTWIAHHPREMEKPTNHKSERVMTTEDGQTDRNQRDGWVPNITSIPQPIGKCTNEQIRKYTMRKYANTQTRKCASSRWMDIRNPW